MCPNCQALIAELQIVTQKYLKTITALKKYGSHKYDCDVVDADIKDRVFGIDLPTPGCTCGFTEVFNDH